MLELIVLGQIPGTNYQITYTQISLLISVLLIAYLGIREKSYIKATAHNLIAKLNHSLISTKKIKVPGLSFDRIKTALLK